MTQNAPQARIDQMMTGYWMSQSLYVAAKLGIADLLIAGPQTAAELASLTGTHAPSLYRLLRALASVEVFQELDGMKFTLTPAAECLRSDRPNSQRFSVIMSGEEHYQAWGQLMYSVQTGATGFEKLYGEPIFEYLGKHPEAGAIFDAAMTGIHGREAAGVADAYDFSAFRQLVDVGGGNGSQLRAILTKHSRVHGVLFDLPQVVERAKPRFAEAGLAGRYDCASGSFFESVPPGADAYLLRHIIHDWSEDQCVTILKNCRKAMHAASKLLIVETVIPPGNTPSFAKFLDLTMLVIPGGMERTESEYRDLLQKCDLALQRVVPTQADVSIIEALPVG